VHDLTAAAGATRQELRVTSDVTVATRVVVRGRVQGVFFRASTRDQARARGVTGWVRNLADGAVEAWLEGPRHAVTAVTDWIVDGGPPHASVDQVDTEEVDPVGHERFVVRHDAR
jgi:acylphosphatase